jgi:hypothetical protein
MGTQALQGIFLRSASLPLDAIRSMYTDCYVFPDELCKDTSPNSTTQKIMAPEKVKLDSFLP